MDEAGDYLGTIRAFGVDEWCTNMWMIRGNVEEHVSDLGERHPRGVERKKFVSISRTAELNPHPIQKDPAACCVR